MDVRFLQSFVSVVDGGSIAEASRRLNLSPSAVAQRLQSLEAELGHRLVIRTGRTVRPTPAGLAVLAHARRLIDAARDLHAIAASDEPEGQLFLGATATALTGLLPSIMCVLQQRYPRIKIFVSPGASVDLYHAVTASKLDAALMVEPTFEVPKSTAWLTLREEPLILIASENLGERDPIDLLNSQPFIRYDRNQWGGQIVDRFLRKHAPDVQTWLELDALDSIAALVDRELGVAIVPDWAQPWPADLRLRKYPLAGGGTRRTGVLWNRSGQRAAAINAFVEACSVADISRSIPQT